MAGFKLDKDNTGFKPMDKGEYEVYPTVFSKEKAQTSGNLMAQFNYTVRDDVDQPFKGQEIKFDNFVDTPTAHWRVNQASEAAGLDMDKEYEDIYDWAADFVNKAVRVVIGHRTDDKGNTYPEVKSFKPSQFGGVYTPPKVGAIGNEAQTETKGEAVEVTDDDLPF